MSGTIEPDASKKNACPRCGTENPDWVRFCRTCGGQIALPAEAAKAEMAHIAYVMDQMEEWRSRRLLAPHDYQFLRNEYQAREKELSLLLGYPEPLKKGTAPENKPGSPAMQRPLVPDLPPLPTSFAGAGSAYASGGAVSPPPAAPYGSPTPSNVPPAASTSKNVPPVPPPPDFSGVRAFFQEHALKLLFALATVMVLVALRSMLAWSWMDAVMMRLLPAVPILLTGMFWQFGKRTHDENPWAAFVYHGLAAALVGFDLFAINRYWLLDALPGPLALLIGMLCTTSAAGWMLVRWREIPYLHLFQIGAVSSIFLLLNLFRPEKPGPFAMLSAGLPYLLYAGLCVGMARRMRTRPAVQTTEDTTSMLDTSLDWAGAWLLWAHLQVALVAALSSLEHLNGGSTRPEAFALLCITAGLLYGSGAQALRDSRMVYAASLFLCAGGTLWLLTSNWLLSGMGYLTLALGLSALALSAYNRRLAQSEPAAAEMAHAYRKVAQTGVASSTLLVWGHTIFWVASGYTLPDALANALLALLCGGSYLAFARQEETATFLYAALSAFGLAVVNTLAWQHAPLGAYPLALSLYGSLLYAVSCVLLQKKNLAEADNWSSVFARMGHGAAGVGMLLALGIPFEVGLVRVWQWSLATLTVNATLYGIAASRTRSVLAAYLCLFNTAVASSVLTWRLLPSQAHLTDCLAPFLLGASLLSLWLSRTPGTTAVSPDAGSKSPVSAPQEPSLWRTPAGMTTLFALAIVAGEAFLAILFRVPAPHLSLSLVPALLSALFVTAGRRDAEPDPLRSLSIYLFCALAGLETCAVIGLRDGLFLWRAEVLQACGLGLVSLGWLWWAGGRTLSKINRSDRWGSDFAVGGLATAFASTFLFGLTALQHGIPNTLNSLLFVAGLTAAFLLFMADIAMNREEFLLLPAFLITVLSGNGYAIHLNPTTPLVLPAVALSVLIAAGSYQLAGWKIKNTVSAWLSVVPLVGAYVLLGLSRRDFAVSSQDSLLTDIIWTVGGIGMAWGYMQAARWSKQGAFAGMAVVTITFVAQQLAHSLGHVPPQGQALALLPLFIVLYVAATRFRAEEQELLAQPIQRTTLSLSALFLLWSACYGDGFLFVSRPASPVLVTLLLLAYGAVYTAVAVHRKTPRSVTASSLTLTGAYLNFLLTRTSVLPTGVTPPLSTSHFAFLAILSGVFWLSAGWFVERKASRADLAAPLLPLAAGLALCCAIIGIASQGELGETGWTIATLGWAGAIWYGLWQLDRGEVCLHVGTWNLLGAWFLTVSHYFGSELALADVYLLPVGLYFIAIGYLASKKAKQDTARALWWLGLLTILVPAFAAYWSHAAGVHTVLLIVECVVSLLWGIGQRIRAFTAAGIGGTILFGASVLIGHLPEMWGTLAALFIGVGLFILAFYALTHRQAVERWAVFFEGRWRVWQAWR